MFKASEFVFFNYGFFIIREAHPQNYLKIKFKGKLVKPQRTCPRAVKPD